MTNVCPVVVIPQRPRAPAEIKWEPRASLQKPHPPTNTTAPSPGSLHPLWLAKGTEGGGRGTAEKTRLGGTAFEPRRSAAARSETFTAGRNAHVYTAAGFRRHCGKLPGPGVLVSRLSWPLKHGSAVGVGRTVVFPPPLRSRCCRRWF